MKIASPIVVFVVLVCLPACLLCGADESPSNARVADGVRLVGKVADPDGAPVADAEVALLRRGAYSGYNVTPRTTKTDANGGFAFDGVAPGEFRIWASKDSLTSRDNQMLGAIIKVHKTTEPVKITLKTGRSIVVTVVSESDGKPIPGATIHLAHALGFPDATTDADGRATLNAIAADTCDLEAFAAGKAKVSKTVNLTSGEQASVDFSLPEGGALKGVITDTKHAPLKGIGVNVYVGNSGMPVDYVKSREDGSYIVDHLPLDQPLRALFSDDNHPSENKSFVISTPKRSAELDAQMQPKPPGGSIAGVVTDRDGNPVAGAKVIYYGHSTRGVINALTKEDGSYRLDGMQTREGMAEQVIVRAKGWAPIAIPVEPGTKDQPAQVDAQLTEKGHTIHGVVVDPKGDSIQGVYVEAGGRTAMDNRALTVVTGNDGRFDFDSLAEKSLFTFRATGYTVMNWKELPLDGTGDVTVEMQPMASIFGKVIDADTLQPIPKFNVKMRTTNIDSRRLEMGENFSAANGTFRLKGLQAGVTMTLVVSAEGYPIQYFDNVATSNDEQADPVELKLSKNPPDHVRIAGRILDANGKALAGVEMRAVAYMPPDQMYPRELRFNWGMLKSGQLSYQRYIRVIESVRTGEDGSFAFPSLPGPDIDLAYWSSSVPPTRMEGVASLPPEQREHMEIAVPAPASLSGKIDRRTYTTLSHLTLRPKGDPMSEMDVPIKENAADYMIPALAAGTYELQLWGKPIRNPDGTFEYEKLGMETVEVKDGEAGKLDLGQVDSTAMPPASAK